MSVLLDDIATALTSAGEVGGVTGWSVFKNIMPEKPNRAVLIQTLSGATPDSRFIIDEPRFIVVIRGEEKMYEEAQTKMESVIDALHSMETSVGANYVFVLAESSGYDVIGRDSNMRLMLSMTFKTMRDG